MRHNIFFLFSLISLLLAAIMGKLISVWWALGCAIISCIWFVVWAYYEDLGH